MVFERCARNCKSSRIAEGGREHEYRVELVSQQPRPVRMAKMLIMKSLTRNEEISETLKPRE